MVKISLCNIITTLLSAMFFFITSCVPLARNSLGEKSVTALKGPKKSNQCIELFVMSQCPYAIEAEMIIIPLIKELKNKVDFTIWFIAEENNGEFFQPPIEISGEIEEQSMDKCHGEFISESGKFKSLHGKYEIEEDIRQVVMAKYYPEKYLDYLLIRSDNYETDNWEVCATKAWIDCKFISRIAQSKEGETLFRQNFKRSHELQINASPTLLINGKPYRGQITRFGINRIICKEGPTYGFCKSTPVCGKDDDCDAEGKVGICFDPDTPNATCKFCDPVNFTLTVIKPQKCPPCSPNHLVKLMADFFPGVEIDELKNDSIEAKNLINDLNISELPALYFEKNITQTARYYQIKDKLLETKNGFLLDPKYIDFVYILDREEKKGNIKLFVESISPRAIDTEDFLIKDGLFQKANIKIHYIAGKIDSQSKKGIEILTTIRDKDTPGLLHLGPQQEQVIFTSANGFEEIQENIRQICINKYYPKEYLNYLNCINENLGKNEGSIDWRQCLMGEKIDHQKIASCINGKEGMKVLLKDIALVENI